MLVDEIEKRLDMSATIKFIFKGGSAILCNNCKDNDLIVVAENHIGIKRFTVDNYDIFVYTMLYMDRTQLKNIIGSITRSRSSKKHLIILFNILETDKW